jgi:putative nucleotidyltransferase with HDIG domain
MKLNSKEAKELLEKIKVNLKDDRWIDHSICVGNTAGIIAKSLLDKGYKVDVDKTITLGYIHDIGKYNGESNGHVIRGYNYLKEKGYDEEYCNVCLTHSYLNNDVLCTAGGIPEDIPFRTNFIKNHKYTLEEKIINLCDLMCPSGNKVFTIDKRLIDIMIRRGTYSNTQYHIKETYKLKEYFDELLGYNLYDLFPEIKNNL